MPTKILLVDNDKFYRELIGDLLKKEGYEVTTASDGIEVLEKIPELKPDGIILDLIMENFDGDQVIKFLRRNEEYKNLPIIVLSGMISAKIPEYEKLDADIFIPKSDIDSLKIALRNNLKTLFKAGHRSSYMKVEGKKPHITQEVHDILIVELLKKSKNFQTILDNLSEGILVSDNNFKITYVNTSLMKMLNLTHEKILGKNLKDFLVLLNARPLAIDEIVKKKVKSNETKSCELFHKDKILKLKASYFKKESTFTGVGVVFSDMTEQKSFEKKMHDEFERKTTELENTYNELQKTNLELIKASEIKSEFVANVSHELRSPLNDIMGFVQLLQAKIYGETTEKQDEALRHILHNSNNLLKMINEILDVTKLDKNQMPLITSVIHPREIIEQVIGSYSWLSEAKDVDVDVFYSDNLPSIETDDTKLRRILLNLLDNAVKFTEKGRVHIKVENLEDEQMIKLTIEDTGVGISDENKEIIFHAFRQIDGSSTRKFGGVGLGLYIVKKLVEMINGTITLESELGKGTKFEIKIPYKLKEEN